MIDRNCPLIVTLRLDAASFQRMNLLRQQHFPAERNVLHAHLTLFHALPPSEENFIRQHLIAMTSGMPAPGLEFSGVRSLGNGVAVTVCSDSLLRLRARLAAKFAQWLTPQDRQDFRPHITIQNKVPVAAARALLESLQATWVPAHGTGEALLLWRYLGGPWEPAGEFPFAAYEASLLEPLAGA